MTDNPIILKGNEWPCSRISKSTQKCCHIRRVNTFKLPKLFYYQLMLFLKALCDFNIMQFALYGQEFRIAFFK